MPKRRRLSRAHRAAISRGLHRYWRGVRRAKAKRRRQARTRRALKKLQQAARDRKREREEWEITIRYSPTQRRAAVGLTMRVIAPAGTPRDVVLLVAKRAGQDRVESGFRVERINWQRAVHGRPHSYDYGDDVATGLQVPGWASLFLASAVRAEKVSEE